MTQRYLALRRAYRIAYPWFQGGCPDWSLAGAWPVDSRYRPYRTVPPCMQGVAKGKLLTKTLLHRGKSKKMREATKKEKTTTMKRTQRRRDAEDAMTATMEIPA
ncbi:hypothetical protein TEQG_00589 [Trichophyton equinum CBS 127.97]|uniref:Uncharacterized protein n=1 Tax=Trichophyton equinum (strain ATCC MYA-4606 / CBS 127.97) TaxID=559882 RepID=F2PHY1_TRIEC|nr:hypothetical protein TEQG_00589 [Trichophyton equinum CBS 127.97]